MRRQYHLRKTERGLLAWDVHRLMELTKDLVPHMVALADIVELDEVYWFDDHGHQPTVRNVIGHMQLVEATELTYPIILSADGRVMDGMHRIAKAILSGKSHIVAVRFGITTEPDHAGVHPDELDYGDD